MSKVKISPDRGWCGNPERGAALGRHSNSLEGKVRLQRMKMSPCGAYDEGGTYWGCGDPQIGYMYVAEDGEGRQAFLRARDREHAKEQLKKNHQVTFYR